MPSGRLQVTGADLACEVGVLDRAWRPLVCAIPDGERVLARVQGGVLTVRRPGLPDEAYVKANPLAVALGVAWRALAEDTSPGARLLVSTPDATMSFASSASAALDTLGHAPTGARALGALQAHEWTRLAGHLRGLADLCAAGRDAGAAAPEDCLRDRAHDAGVVAVLSTLVLEPEHGRLLGDPRCTPVLEQGVPRPLPSTAPATAAAVPPSLLLPGASVHPAPLMVERDELGRTISLSWQDTPLTAWSYTPADATPTRSVVFRYRSGPDLASARLECR